MTKRFIVSESVGCGHPDKVCDQISDAVLDQCLCIDPNSRVACETFITRGLVVVGGEITTAAYVDIQALVRNVIGEIGYLSPLYGFDEESCAVLNAIQSQSPDIAQGVDRGGAGDQGLMVGYACDQNEAFLPDSLYYAHKLVMRLKELRESALNPFTDDLLGPDCKSQVVFSVDEAGHKKLENVLVSTQHTRDDMTAVHHLVREMVIEVMGDWWYCDKPELFVNPTGRFMVAGPAADTGLTGRKIIVDTYGGVAPHGGGAFSGKDASKVDRSAAYMARYIAKNMVAAGVAKEVIVTLAYAIGVADPVSLNVELRGNPKIYGVECDFTQIDWNSVIREIFPLTPLGIIDKLGLRKPIFRETACFGHFGRSLFSWEQLDQVSAIRSLL